MAALAVSTPSAAQNAKDVARLRRELTAVVQRSGQPCPRAKTLVAAGGTAEARVYKLICGPVRGGSASAYRAYRFTLFANNRVEVVPWR